jgi:hypothetical protein
MKKSMLISEAWREIARRFDEERPSFGLCREIDELYWTERITLAQNDSMCDTINDFLYPHGAYAWPAHFFGGRWRQQHDTYRVYAALFFAAMEERP